MLYQGDLANFQNKKTTQCLILKKIPIGSVLLWYPSPDMSAEQEIVHKIADLTEKLRHANSINDQRKIDLQLISRQFSSLIKLVKDHQVSTPCPCTSFVLNVDQFVGSGIYFGAAKNSDARAPLPRQPVSQHFIGFQKGFTAGNSWNVIFSGKCYFFYIMSSLLPKVFILIIVTSFFYKRTSINQTERHQLGDGCPILFRFQDFICDNRSRLNKRRVTGDLLTIGCQANRTFKPPCAWTALNGPLGCSEC